LDEGTGDGAQPERAGGIPELSPFACHASGLPYSALFPVRAQNRTWLKSSAQKSGGAMRNRLLVDLAVIVTTTAMLAAPALGLAGAPAATQSVVEQLAGGWRLVSRVTTGADGKVLADPGLSAAPAGVLIYDRFGHVAAQLSRPGRTVEMLGEECRAAEKVRGTSDTAQTIIGYDAYFGTYTLDVRAGVITHHLESAIFPGDIGKDIKRDFSVDGDTLTIRFHTTLSDGTAVLRTLTWARWK
jgi:hypothetical protein